MGSPARIVLSRLQSGWLDWLASINSGDEAGARAAVERIQAYAAQVGMQHLPELSLSAAVRAVEAAEAGQTERSAWALQAAELFDPGRPSTAFAAADVARQEGAWARALGAQARGYARTVTDPFLRELSAHSVAAWAVRLLLLVCLAFSGVRMAVSGPVLYWDLQRGLGRLLPAPLTHPSIWVLLLWPLVLPSGLVWLALYWSVLLWLYGDLVQRTVTVAAWLLVAAVPLSTQLQERRVEVLLDPGLRAIQAAGSGRLPGGLLIEAALLEARLPDSIAVQHATADLHRLLGQCDVARRHYFRVLEAETQNSAALSDLGLCSYRAGNYERAIQDFQLAAEQGPPRAEVEFNLSQAFSELYRFSEAESALRAARSIDAEKVSQWISSGDPRLIIPVNGGLRRTPEIGRALVARMSGGGSERSLFSGPWRLGVVTALLSVILMLVLRSALGIGGRRPGETGARWLPGAADLWRRVLLPGVPEGETGSWGRGFVAVLVPAALLSLLDVGRVGLAMPWGLEPGGQLRWVVAGTGLVLYFSLRFLDQSRNG